MKVDLKGAFSVTVTPVSWKDGRLLMKHVGRIVEAASVARVASGGDDEATVAGIVNAVMPIVTDDLMDLVEKCIRFPEEKSVDDLGAEHIPAVLEAWIGENLTPGNLKSWTGLGKAVMSKLTSMKSSSS